MTNSSYCSSYFCLRPKHEIKEASVDQRIEMQRDNEAMPLKCPCTAVRLIQFIDCAPPGSHSFSVPDAFRQAVTESVQATDTAPQVPEEAREQAAHSGATENAAPEVTPAGISKKGILSVDRPLPEKAPTPEKILNNLPKWVEPACTRVGRVGKGADGSHLWNPAVLAACLAMTTPQDKWKANKAALTNLLSRSFTEYLQQWEEALERL